MANVNLSLDDIIKKSKNTKVGGGRRVGGGGGVRRSLRGGGGGRPNFGRRSGGGRDKYFSDDVPSGKWKHDKFFEAYGKGGSSTSGKAGASGGARRPRGGKEMVKLNISNLPPSVVTEDLEELFQDFEIYGVAVHYDESGAHLGTATIFASQNASRDIIREYANIAIDGQEIKIGIVYEDSVLPIKDRIHRIGGSGGSPKRRRSGGAGSSGGRRSGGGRVTKPSRGGKKLPVKQMTVDELDRELESYMSNRQAKEN